MAEKPAPKPGGTHLNIAVLVIIWVTFMIVVLSNPSVRKFLSSLITPPGGYYQDVIVISPSDNVFKNSKVYYDKKPDIYDIAQSQSNQSKFWAATNYGLFVSSDGGLSWYHFDLPKAIGAETPVYRIFTDPQSATEISILILNSNNGIIYTTNDSFYSFVKSFEITKDLAAKIASDRNISTIIPTSNNGFVVGTTR